MNYIFNCTNVEETGEICGLMQRAYLASSVLTVAKMAFGKLFIQLSNTDTLY